MGIGSEEFIFQNKDRSGQKYILPRIWIVIDKDDLIGERELESNIFLLKSIYFWLCGIKVKIIVGE